MRGNLPVGILPASGGETVSVAVKDENWLIEPYAGARVLKRNPTVCDCVNKREATPDIKVLGHAVLDERMG